MVFVVTHPPDPRPALVVETVPRADTGAVERLKQRMLSSGCPNGLLFDDNECVIVKDTYTSTDAASLVEDGRVPTNGLLALVPARGGLDQRVLAWLRSMSAAWSSALPKDKIAAPLIADIVPAVSGSSIREVA